MNKRQTMTVVNDKALVVFSGGQDSTTCLYWALEKFGAGNVSTLTFDYGQRHRIELQCAVEIAAQLGVAHDILPVDTFAAIGGDALTDKSVGVANAKAQGSNLPNTFVPGRNIIFLTYAAAWAWRHGIYNLVTGVAQTDYSGYPDCREDTIASVQHSLRLGMESDFVIHTPLMHLSKKETVELAVDVGALNAMALTHTCYLGQRPPCGSCAACELRAKGFAAAGIADPLLESS